MSPKRGTLSVSRRLYDRLHAHCEAAGVSMSSLVENLVEPVLESGQPPPRQLRPQVAVQPDHVSRIGRETLDRIAADRKNLGLLAVQSLARGPVALDIPPHVSSALFDQLARLHAAGCEVEPGRVLEAAIDRMVSALEREPWCRVCLENPGNCQCSRRASVPR